MLLYTHTPRLPAPSAEQRRCTNAQKIRSWGKNRLFSRLRAAGRPGGVPFGNLHRAVLVEVLVHVKGIPPAIYVSMIQETIYWVEKNAESAYRRCGSWPQPLRRHSNSARSR
jgi:hypothetical protein